MGSLNISIPDTVLGRVEQFAQEDGVSVEEFVASVLSQRIAVADAGSYVRQRAAKGSAGQLLELLEKAPAVEPVPSDSKT